MTTIYLLRHGKIDAPAALYGKTDVGVTTENNQAILTALSQHHRYFSQILTSPLKRCQAIAECFSQQAKLPLHTLDALQEMNFGLLDGLAFDEFSQDCNQNNKQESWQTLVRFWQNPHQNTLPEAESLAEFHQRISSVWQDILSRYCGQNILVITHGGVIRMILALLLKLDWRNPSWFSQLNIANASVSCIDYHDETQQGCINGISLPIAALSLHHVAPKNDMVG